MIVAYNPSPVPPALAPVVWMPGPALTEDSPTLLNVLASLAVFGLGLYCLGKLFEEPDPRARRRSSNLEPLAWQDREYVSLRDGWRGTYCGKRVTRATRHIDHSVTRRNLSLLPGLKSGDHYRTRKYPTRLLPASALPSGEL